MIQKQYKELLKLIIDAIPLPTCIVSELSIVLKNKEFDGLHISLIKDINKNDYHVEKIKILEDSFLFILKPNNLKALENSKNALRKAIALL